MASTQDAQVGIAVESTFGTPVAPTRFYEYVDESLDWSPNIVQGKGLRVGKRVDRSARRTAPTADGDGDLTLEWASKGLGLLLQNALGGAVSTLVSGSTQQQLFTIGDNPSSLTIQKGVVEVGGTVDAITYSGCMCSQLEIDFPNADIAQIKATFDAAQVGTGTALGTASYPTEPVNLFHFANGSIFTGTLTAPTTTALASMATTLADIRGGSLTINNNIRSDRQNFGGGGGALPGGRKAKQLTGKRDISGSIDVEYDSTTFRDAVINQTPMGLLLQYTAGALSTGVETVQIVLPEVKFNGQMPMTNSTDLIVQSMGFNVLDNLTATQPIWIVVRTADATL